MELLGRATSSNVQAVMWAAAEMGIDLTRRDVGGRHGGNDTDAFLAINPMGRVPVLVDDDLALFESQAIIRYITARFGKAPFWPDDPAARAKIDQWAEWAKVNVAHAVIYKVFWHLVRESKATRDHGLIAQGVKELKTLMGIADAQIAEQGYLVGRDLTVADIAFGTQLFRYFTVDFDRADLPNLAAYYDRLTANPHYQKHVMVDYSELRHPDA